MSVGDFRHEDCPRVIFATRTVRQTHNSTLTLPVDCPVLLSPRGQYISTHIARWPFPWTVRVIFAHEDCPSVDNCVLMESQRGLFGGGSNLSDKGLNSVDRGSKATLPLTIPRRDLSRLQRILPAAVVIIIWRSERRSRTDLANDTRLWEPAPTEGRQSGGGRCAASSPDSDLEALSHNPAHGSFTPLAFQPSAMTNCANQRFLSHQVELLLRRWHQCAAQPNSPPDNVLRSIDPKRVLGLKEGVVTPPPIHGSDSLVRISVLSWLFDARESSRRAAPSPPPPTRGGPLATLALKQPANSRRVRTGTPSPALRANPFPGYGSILPTSLPTLFHRPEAVHLGDLMRYEYDRRERTRSSGFSRAGMHRHHATRRCSSSR
ncbi:hypothetical protein Bca4012_102612 [Brassica carinata]